jgi:predicted metal-dependent phosphoesterase TrpH
LSSQGYADLHLHTHYSDGTYTPAEAVRLGLEQGYRAIAICDHDSIDAVQEAIAEGERVGLEVIPGVELSVHFFGKDVHILGYCFDPASTELREHLALFSNRRRERGEEMVRKLRELGLDVTVEDLLAEVGEGVVGRPHVADALVRKGLVADYDEAFGRYIGFGGPAYVEKFKLSVAEAVDLLAQAGGVAVIAHPGIYVGTASVHAMARDGVRGVETRHPKHSPSQVRLFTRLARELSLVETGGSDCHGHRAGDPTLGRIKIPYEDVLRLKAVAGSIRG